MYKIACFIELSGKIHKNTGETVLKKVLNNIYGIGLPTNTV
jgi:hypothetical protein